VDARVTVGNSDIRVFVMGPLETNCYLIVSGREAIVVDPAWVRVDKIVEMLKDESLKLRAIIATHGHFDHIAGVRELRRRLGSSIPFLVHRGEMGVLQMAPIIAERWFGIRIDTPVPDDYLSDGDSVALGLEELRVIHTPGHTPGSVVLVGKGFVLTGDTLFAGSVGRTDLPGSSWEELRSSLRRIVAEVDHESLVLPGHGPLTRLKDELIYNPFLAGI